MFRLASILYSVVATTLAGIAIIIALTIGQDTLRPIVIAAAIGAVLAVPATWLVTRAIQEMK